MTDTRDPKISEEALQGLKISDAILEEFYNKDIPVEIGLAAAAHFFLRTYILAEVPLPDFIRICTGMIEVIQKEEEIRRDSKK